MCYEAPYVGATRSRVLSVVLLSGVNAGAAG